MIEELEKLAALEGVTGLCHHRGGIILWQRLPDMLTKDQAATLCAAVSKAFASYHSGERTLTESYFEFPGHSVLVLARPPCPGEPPREFLTFLLKNREAVAGAAAAGAAIWRTEA